MKKIIFENCPSKKVCMVTPKDNFIETYTKGEIEELKMAFDKMDGYKEKLLFFDRYFDFDISEFANTLASFNFPFPSEDRHQPDEVNRLEKILSITTIEQLVTKNYFEIIFSICPTTPTEWNYFILHFIGRKFVSRENLEKAFWERLAMVPEQEYFLETQINKFHLVDATSRTSVIPFYKQHYSIFQGDPEPKPHLNRWFNLFSTAYSQARREGNRAVPSDPKYLYELYFMNLGYVYAHYLGFLKRCLVEVAEKGRLTAPADTTKTEENEDDTPSNGRKGELSHKSQILLLKKLGIFDLEIFRDLTDLQRGKLFGRLLNRNIDNTENYIRYRNGKDVNPKYVLVNKLSSPPVDDLLRECGLEDL